MITQLQVRLFDRPAGDLGVDGEVRSPEDWHFAYSRDYLRVGRPVALSASLPLRSEPFRGAVVRNWFGNLLPEGGVREAIAARLRLPVWDDFALLAAVGGECAGAVSMAATGGASVRNQPDPTLDLEHLLASAGTVTGEGTWALLGTPSRLSLAGAQDKIAVMCDAGGHLRLPHVGEPTTHVLKPDSLRLRGLCDLEALGLALAGAIGLDAVSASLIHVAGHKALLLARYDRHVVADHLERLHQEDFCQALGYPGELKYEAGGGPSLARCAGLIRRQLRLGPEAVRAFLDWVVFNAVIGNADAHAKNLAVVCGRDGRRRLAPFYDLVPTIAISERLFERRPALAIGSAERIEAIAAAHWREFAIATGYAPGFVLKRVAAIAGGIIARVDGVAGELVTHGADAAAMEGAAAAVAAQASRVLQASR